MWVKTIERCVIQGALTVSVFACQWSYKWSTNGDICSVVSVPVESFVVQLVNMGIISTNW